MLPLIPRISLQLPPRWTKVLKHCRRKTKPKPVISMQTRDETVKLKINFWTRLACSYLTAVCCAMLIGPDCPDKRLPTCSCIGSETDTKYIPNLCNSDIFIWLLFCLTSNKFVCLWATFLLGKRDDADRVVFPPLHFLSIHGFWSWFTSELSLHLSILNQAHYFLPFNLLWCLRKEEGFIFSFFPPQITRRVPPSNVRSVIQNFKSPIKQNKEQQHQTPWYH